MGIIMILLYLVIIIIYYPHILVQMIEKSASVKDPDLYK